MNKQQAYQAYERAAKLRIHSPISEWFKVFPDRASLERFRQDVGQISFPEFYGDSPWDDAFGIAYQLHHGISPFSHSYYRNYGHKQHVKSKLAILRAYGANLSEDLEDLIVCPVCGDIPIRDNSDLCSRCQNELENLQTA